MNKQVNQGLKDLINWSNSNKNYLYISKTDVVSFKLSANLTNVPLKLKVSGNLLYPTNTAKYSSIKIDDNLNWKQ